MKKLILLWLLFPVLVQAQDLSPKETPLPTTIEQVRVYTSGAQISRKGNVKLTAGTHIMVISDLSAYLDPGSVKVKTPAGVTLLSLNHRFNFLKEKEKNAAAEQLEQQLEQIQDSIEILKTEQLILEEEADFLQKNSAVAGDQNGLKLEELKRIAEYQQQRRQFIHKKQLQLNWDIDDLDEKTTLLAAQLQEVQQQKAEHSSELILKLKTEKNTNGKLELSYLAEGASWFPAYDVRVDQLHAPLQLLYKANLTQNTGEDWDNVQLVFSNAQPDESGDAPTLSPVYLTPQMRYAQSSKYRSGIYNPAVRKISGIITDTDGEPLIGVNILASGTTQGTVSDIDGRYELLIPEGVREIEFQYVGFTSKRETISEENMNIRLEHDDTLLEEVVVVGYASDGLAGRVSGVQVNKNRKKEAVETSVVNYSTSVDFVVEEPYTVASNGKTYSIQLHDHDVEAFYHYEATPKLKEAAFLFAEVTGWEQYNLLTGEASLFFEDTYLGKTLLDPSAMSDTLSLSLGTDQSIRIKREKLPSSSKSSFIGNKQTEARHWKISVRNNKQQAITLKLFDQIPVTENKDIDVETEERSGAKIEKETGLVEWEMNIPAGRQQERELRYTVRFPKDYTVIIE